MGRPRIVPTDLTGMRFGRLVAIERVPQPDRVAGQPTAARREWWRLACDCGNPKVACHRDLLSGGTRSCGCLRNERAREALTVSHAVRARRLTLNNETHTVREWSARLGIPDQTIRARLAKGLLAEAALAPSPRPRPRTPDVPSRRDQLPADAKAALLADRYTADVLRRALELAITRPQGREEV